jgi:hypothetical protein
MAIRIVQPSLFGLFAEFQCDFRIHVTAIITGRMGQLGLVAFLADRIIHRFQAMMAAACPRSAFACFPYR